MNVFEDGYYAGLINERNNPHLYLSAAYCAWWYGNQVGLTAHCALVEAIYISEGEA